MGLKESAEQVRRRAEEVKSEVRGVLRSFRESMPRPLMERLASRPTLLLREPLVKRLRERRKKL